MTNPSAKDLDNEKKIHLQNITETKLKNEEGEIKAKNGTKDSYKSRALLRPDTSFVMVPEINSTEEDQKVLKFQKDRLTIARKPLCLQTDNNDDRHLTSQYDRCRV